MTDQPDGPEDLVTEVLWLGNCTCGAVYEVPDVNLRDAYPHLSEEFKQGAFITACADCDADVTLHRQDVKIIPFSAWKILPPADGCSECGREHEPWMPHDLQQMIYQYQFYSNENRWPTWSDAMAHCTDDVKRDWIKAMARHGVKI